MALSHLRQKKVIDYRLFALRVITHTYLFENVLMKRFVVLKIKRLYSESKSTVKRNGYLIHQLDPYFLFRSVVYVYVGAICDCSIVALAALY